MIKSLKCFVVMLAVVFISMIANAAPVVQNVHAEQPLPWKILEIEYEIVGDATGCGLDVYLEDSSVGSKIVATEFVTPPQLVEGRHKVIGTWVNRV